jgi:hypothetical protein
MTIRRQLGFAGLAVALVLLGAAPQASNAGSPPDLEKFVKRVRKLAGAPDDDSSTKPKRLCVCWESHQYTRVGCVERQ